MAQANNSKKKSSLTSDSLFEQLRGLSSGAQKSVKNDVVKGGAQAAWKQFWGVETESISQESSEIGASYEKMTAPEEVERKGPPKRGAYEIRQEITVFSGEERQTMQEIQLIRSELLAIVKTMKDIDVEVEKAIKEVPVKPGVYHVRYLERIRKILKLIREKLENSKLWLQTSNSKRKAKGYWGMYKKKGTSFGLSSERVVSTQTG